MDTACLVTSLNSAGTVDDRFPLGVAGSRTKIGSLFIPWRFRVNKVGHVALHPLYGIGDEFGDLVCLRKGNVVNGAHGFE